MAHLSPQWAPNVAYNILFSFIFSSPLCVLSWIKESNSPKSHIKLPWQNRDSSSGLLYPSLTLYHAASFGISFPRNSGPEFESSLRVAHIPSFLYHLSNLKELWGDSVYLINTSGTVEGNIGQEQSSKKRAYAVESSPQLWP